MRTRELQRVRIAILALAASALLPMSAEAQTQSGWGAEKWQFDATIYGWLPAIDMIESGKSLEDFRLNGPMGGVVFSW